MHGNLSFEQGALEREIAIRGKSLGEFAQIAKIDSATLSRAVRGDRLRPRSFGKILTALGATPVINGPIELVRAS